ncbi:hypothetical protein PsYK624_086580 [Phanerochaete sordida]|uniref:BTB domain-containing protein n=1 Tax=Phanerochaete sordida TaxID=48140 RepID=A0A9P3GDS9_9APHY|nr:hypothetical protein PsYK624_086580 [Phanerochaete sordida]
MSTPLHILTKVPSGGGLEDALADALSGKPFNDVTFCTTQDEVGDVHANSRILMSASRYFRELLAEEAAGKPVPTPLGESTATIVGGAHDEEASTLGDDDDIDALESLLATPSEVSFGDDEEMMLPDSASEDSKSVSTTNRATSSTRVITLENVASDTLRAAIFYIYTGKVYFLPLLSPVSDEAQGNPAKEYPNRPACSCKAEYRFADEAGLPELKQLAEAHLFAELNASNILNEVLSPFSSQHPAILRRQVDILLEKYWTPETHAGLGPLLEQLVRGELPHAGPALTMLLGEVPPVAAPRADAPRAKTPPAALPPTGPSAASPLPAPGRRDSAWDALKTSSMATPPAPRPLPATCTAPADAPAARPSAAPSSTAGPPALRAAPVDWWDSVFEKPVTVAEEKDRAGSAVQGGAAARAGARSREAPARAVPPAAVRSEREGGGAGVPAEERVSAATSAPTRRGAGTSSAPGQSHLASSRGPQASLAAGLPPSVLRADVTAGAQAGSWADAHRGDVVPRERAPRTHNQTDSETAADAALRPSSTGSLARPAPAPAGAAPAVRHSGGGLRELLLLRGLPERQHAVAGVRAVEAQLDTE